MTITFSYKHCQKRLQVRNHLAGKQVKCPVRGYLVTVPAVVSVAYSPDGRGALSGSEDRTALLWEMPARAV